MEIFNEIDESIFSITKFFVGINIRWLNGFKIYSKFDFLLVSLPTMKSLTFYNQMILTLFSRNLKLILK
jgi:hypothetical protein